MPPIRLCAPDRNMRVAKMGLAVLSACLALLLGEGALRVLEAAKEMRRGRHMCRLAHNPALGYEPIPGFHSPLIRINRYGFRGPEFDVHKAPGVFRIVVLGDSITFAPYLAQEKLYVSLLEKQLNATTSGGTTFEVLNAGVGGYNIWQYGEVYRAKVKSLQPDLVIVGICQNDFVRHGRLYTDWFGIVRGDLDHEAKSRGGERFLCYRAFQQAWATLARRRTDAAVTRQALIQTAPTLAGLWQEGAPALDALRHALQQDGVKTVWVIFPYRFQLETETERESDAHFSAFCARQHAVCLDLFEAFRHSGGPRLFLDHDHIHPNESGHALVANGLYRCLRDRRVIADDPPDRATAGHAPRVSQSDG